MNSIKLFSHQIIDNVLDIVIFTVYYKDNCELENYLNNGYYLSLNEAIANTHKFLESYEH